MIDRSLLDKLGHCHSAPINVLINGAEACFFQHISGAWVSPRTIPVVLIIIIMEQQIVMRGQSSTRSFIPEISSPQNDKDLYAFKQGNVFLLGNSNIQYALSLNETTGKLSVLHWGPVLSTISPLLLPHDEDVSGGDEHSSIYTDFPIYGDGDDREPALKVSRHGTGIRSFDF